LKDFQKFKSSLLEESLQRLEEVMAEGVIYSRQFVSDEAFEVVLHAAVLVEDLSNLDGMVVYIVDIPLELVQIPPP
jgi:hypothetical protein